MATEPVQTVAVEPAKPTEAKPKEAQCQEKQKKERSVVRKARHTDRSRLVYAIQNIAKNMLENKRGKSPLTSMAVGLLEDICIYVIKRVAADCSRLLEGRSTIKLQIIRAAVRLNIRSPTKMLGEIETAANEWVEKYGRELTANADREKATVKVRTSGECSVMPGFTSPSRVGKLLRRYASGHPRLSFVAAVYMAGIIEEIMGLFIGTADEAFFDEKIPKDRAQPRLGIDQFYMVTRNDLDLNAVIPFTMITQFGNDSDYMPRHKRHKGKKDSDSEPEAEAEEYEEEQASPPKKKKARTSSKPKKTKKKKADAAKKKPVFKAKGKPKKKRGASKKSH